MSRDTKCVLWENSRNIYGEPIILSITKYDNKTMEIVIKFVFEHSLYKRCLLLLLVILLDIILYMKQVLTSKSSIFIFIVVLIFIYNIVFTVKLERIFIVQPLGFQIEVHYLLKESIQFIAFQNIKSLIINDVILRQRVIFILSMLTKDNTSKERCTVIPLFTETLPRLHCLETIYQHIHNQLFS